MSATTKNQLEDTNNDYIEVYPERSRRNSVGKLLSDGNHTYFYDAENRLIQVDGTLGTCSSGGTTGTTACYYYDAQGHRVFRTGYTSDTCDSTGKRGYVFDLAGRWLAEVNQVNGTGCTGEIYVGNRHLATSDGDMHLDHTDWLGTSRLLTDYQYTSSHGFWIGQSCASLAFGDALNCTSTFDYHLHFTGKERDSESGLDSFGARYDSSSFGRFVTPDQPFFDQSPENPQSWNLYSYVLNNPISDIDSNGEACVSTDGGKTYHNDDSGGQNCADAAQPEKEKFTYQGGSQINAFFLNFFFKFNSAANDFFRPITNLMGIQPSYMQNIPTGSGVSATAGAALATTVTFFIGPEAEGINITAEGFAHVAEGHIVGGAKAVLGKKSIFGAGEDVKALIKAAEGVRPTRMGGGDFARVVDAGRPIGIDRATGAPTSTYTVITKPNGDLVNAFPGKP